MDDRDHFAAAALAGLLEKHDAASPNQIAAWWPETVCAAAYRWADAMLRERDKTNHDAAPEATGHRIRSETTADCGSVTGNPWSPLWNPKPGEILPKAVVGFEYDEHLREHVAKMGDGKTAWKDLPKLSRLSIDWLTRTPEWLKDFTDTKPMPEAATGIGSVTENPVAWAVMADDWFHDVRLSREGAEWYSSYLNNKAGKEKCRVVPLYRHTQPTLTDAEREAIKGCTAYDEAAAAIIRNLLERLK